MKIEPLFGAFLRERSFPLVVKVTVFVASFAAFAVLFLLYQTGFLSRGEARLVLYFFYILIFFNTFFVGFAPGILFAVLSSIMAITIILPPGMTFNNMTVAELELFPFLAMYFLVAVTVDWFRENIELLQNQIAENEKLHEQARHMEKLALAGEIAAGIAHEIRNPLTVVQGYVQLLLKKVGSGHECDREVYTLILDEIRRTNHIIGDFLRFSRPDSPKKAMLSLNELLENAASLIYGEAVRKNVQIYFYPDPDLPEMYLDKDQMMQVFLNLFSNALQAMPDGGSLSVLTSLDRPGGSVYVRISDTGHGIEPELLGKLFIPFFTTRDNGTGLGLSISQNIVAAHQGWIEVESTVGEGSRFTIRLPVTTEGGGGEQP